MKPILLLALVCIVFLTASAQTSDKWIITPDAKIKKGFGRLDMSFPDSVYWWIIVYDKDDKMVKSFYPNEKIKTFTLSPGFYQVDLSGVKIQNVQIKADNATTLISGVANIESAEEYWQLYSTDKENFFTSSSLFDGTAYQLFEASRKISKQEGRKKLKLALPVGNYQLKEGENYKVIEVKGEITSQQNSEITETDYYIITPMNPVTAGMGLLNMKVPKDTTVKYKTPDGKTHTITMHLNVLDSVIIGYNGQYSDAKLKLPKLLSPNDYYIVLNGRSFNGFDLPVLPVNAGKETRIKCGYLIITRKTYDPNNDLGDEAMDVLLGEDGEGGIPYEWTLSSPNNNNMKFKGKKSTIFALPPGEYILWKEHPPGYNLESVFYLITIADGQWVVNGTKCKLLITEPPQNQTADVGTSATFSVSANGTNSLKYEWYRNGVLIPDATSSSYKTPTLSMSDNGSKYRCVVTTCYSNYYTPTATLTVKQQGTIHRQQY